MQYFRVPHPTILEITGRDSPRYLNARLTNDIRTLLDGAGCIAAALTPQGKAQALFSVHRLGRERFILICDDGDREEIVSAFKKYIVADRVEVFDLSESYELLHIIPTDTNPSLMETLGLATPQTRYSCLTSDGSYSILRYRTLQAGVDILLPKNESLTLQENLSKVGALNIDIQQQTFARIEAGIPSFPLEINSNTLFSESGLIEAISFKKGCYVGQEVVERIDALGKLSKRLARIRFEGVHGFPSVSGAEDNSLKLSPDEDRDCGRIVSSAVNEDKSFTLCFATIRQDVPQGADLFFGSIKGEVL